MKILLTGRKNLLCAKWTCGSSLNPCWFEKLVVNSDTDTLSKLNRNLISEKGHKLSLVLFMRWNNEKERNLKAKRLGIWKL